MYGAVLSRGLTTAVNQAPVLEAIGVRKSYGSTVALEGMDLEAEEGSVVALLGPNGAGKTSFVTIVAGLRRPDAGAVRVGGIDVARQPHQVRGHIGYAPQDTGVYLPLTVRENLRFFAGLAGLRRTNRERRIDEVANALVLGDLLPRRTSDLSGGERRRLHTAIALVHRPRLLLLDEPTTGADVQTRGELLRLVRELAEDGSAVVYTTHYLHEVEELDAHVVCVDRGRVVARGDVSELIDRHGSSALELTFDRPVSAVSFGEGAEIRGTFVRIPTGDPAREAARLLADLGPDISHVAKIEVVRPSLESVYLGLTGERHRSRSEEPVA